MALLTMLWRAELFGTAGHFWPAGHGLRITDLTELASPITPVKSGIKRNVY